MKLRYIDTVKHLPPAILESVIHEAPHTLITGDIPEPLKFLDGNFIDLGFENLGLPREEAAAIYKGFLGSGVGIPGTGYKLRYTKIGVTMIEPIDGDEAMLPDHWAEAVLVLDSNGSPLYAGKRVRPDQLGIEDKNEKMVS